MWGKEPPDPRDADVSRGYTSLVIACVLILLVCCGLATLVWVAGLHVEHGIIPTPEPSISYSDEGILT